MSKQYAHLHTMAKTSVKFQNDWPKTVGGVALTSQLLMNRQMDEWTGHSTPISHLRANTGATKKTTRPFLHISLSIKDSLEQQIHYNGNIFRNKCCRCNEGSLYLTYLLKYYSQSGPYI